MKNEKFRLVLMVLVTITLLGTIILFSLSIKEINLGNLISISIILLVVFFMTFFILRRYNDIKQGMPFEDERSKKVMTKAAAQSFYISLYWLLLISWFEDFFANKLFGIEQLDAGQALGGGIAGMSVIFFVSWVYYDKKGKLV